jgi:hypothetical protein
MLIVIGMELAKLAGLLFRFPMPNAKVLILLPFVWLMFESAEKVGDPSLRCVAANPTLKAGHLP